MISHKRNLNLNLKNVFRQEPKLWILIALFVGAECMVNPLRDFPLNDDWSYAKSVLIYQFDDKLTIGDWPAMTLFTHILWGSLFTGSLGFSFWALRFSTLVSSLIGLLVLQSLIRRISGNSLVALMGALILLFNPIYFNLSNTFMTDVNFTTLLLLDVYLIHSFFESKKHRLLFWIFLVSVLLVLLRQFGLILPLAFFLSCLFIPERRLKYSAMAFMLFLLVLFALKYYEAYLQRILPGYAMYKFSEGIDPLSQTFLERSMENFKARYKILLVLIMCFTAPYTMVFLPAQLRRLGLWKSLMLLLLVMAGSWWIFGQEPFPFKNIFSNMSVGPEAYYQNTQHYMQHSYSESFTEWMNVVKVLLAGFFLTGLICFLWPGHATKRGLRGVNPFAVFMVLLMLMYTAELFITESFFDRYALPLLPLVLILTALYGLRDAPKLAPALVVLPFLFYVAVYGTKDYFTLQEKTWEAYEYLRRDKGIAPDRINAGFEISCWNEGQITWWTDYLSLEPYDYLIQFKPEPGFTPLKSFEFRRFFPPKHDKINIFARDSILDL